MLCAGACNSPSKTVVVLGPTASGKTRLGVALARWTGGEILSADSRQVYRGLDIGTGKDLREYAEGGQPVTHHLIDIAGLEEEFSVYAYQRAFFEAHAGVLARGRRAIVVGGTGLYLEAVLSGYRMAEVPMDSVLRSELAVLDETELNERLRQLKPDLHNTTDLMDRERTVRAIEIAVYQQAHPPKPAPPVDALVLGVRWPRDALRARIRTRLAERVEAGLIEEVAGLLERGVARERLERLGLEYRFVTHYLDGRIADRETLMDRLATAIGQFAKRQETWFRRMERRGTPIHWVDRAGLKTAKDLLREHGIAS